VTRKKKIIRGVAAPNSADGQTPEKVKSSGKSARPKTTKTRTRKDVGPKPSAAKSRRTIEPSDEQIRTRAYFISERRRRFDLPGDANDDWIEAKRQLLSEFGPR
jgi:hypothetical protein